MVKKVAILQSCYIPWKGYFDLINSVDEFVLYDHVQYTKRDWRNRNAIKTAEGIQWLTIPIKTKGRYHQAILEAEVVDGSWAKAHWKAIEHNYKKAPFFERYASVFKPIYEESQYEPSLSQINFKFILAICEILRINTTISWSQPLKEGLDKTEQLIHQVQHVAGTHYVSGPLAKNYLDEPKFKHANIELSYFYYPDYPEYHQFYGGFVSQVSILDLLFNVGDNARSYISDCL